MGDTSKTAGLSRKVKVKSLDDLDGRTNAAKKVLELASALISALGGAANVVRWRI